MNCLHTSQSALSSPRKVKGQIQIIFGPMFSGKSTELMRRVRRFQIAQYDCLVVKYANDTRYSKEDLATHDKFTMQAVPATKLSEVFQEAEKSSVIGIDEGQFFPDCVEFAEEMANRGKTVIVAALDGTFQRRVEVIGGTDMYRATCRSCYFANDRLFDMGSNKENGEEEGTDQRVALKHLISTQQSKPQRKLFESLHV
ncbi:thymidine kinase, cytosolic isoform X2 [Scyliorhinus canicula]|uniref:thymidine kinase, cytosolic isoform X2 n=1 Tax=Scyliorhinus canicula TaxID=7830 RepID=UPI0018F66B1A|nr:thymidine kinase, cytosolic isoform X2 [Scyliorhinus canicula]